MPMSEEGILQLLCADVPDYAAAATAVGNDGLDALMTLVQSADVVVASRAASLAACIVTNAAAADEAVKVLGAAVNHPDPSVRAAAALGASRGGIATATIVTQCLADPDAGVRLMVFRGLSAPLDAITAATVNTLAATDAQPEVRAQAVDLAVRTPDPTLANELIASALDYLRARLADFASAVLNDAAQFAAALAVPGFGDPGGVVAAQLITACTALNLVAPELAAADFSGAATQLGRALDAVANAAAAVGGMSFISLLVGKVAWTAAAPSGFAAQLGLPSSVPDLSLDGRVLVHRIATGAKQLIGAPLTFGFERAQLTSRLALDGSAPVLSMNLALTGIEAGIGGGPIASLLGSAGGSVQADVEVGVDTARGLTLGAGAGSRVVLPAHPKLGALDCREIALELPQGVANTIDVGCTVAVDIGGLINATVEGAGLHVHIEPAAVSRGANPLSVSLKPPSGIALSIAAAIVRGGGFLDERAGGFGGALQLTLGPIEVKAVGLLTLEPNFALVVVMSIRFLPPIDLTFGFTLNAVGGVIGIEHRLDSDALRAAIRSGGIDDIMFPADPVAAAPAILDTLAQVFPVDQGSIVIGPMIEIGWGRPVSFLTAQVGVIVSLPDPLIVIIGRVRIALPAPELPIVDLRALVYGEITPDHLLILASLNGSRIAGFSVSGDIGFLVSWGGSAELAISAGGFHPRYDPPRLLAGMQRISMSLSPPVILMLRAEAYFAITTNSVQLGSLVEMAADLGFADFSGHYGFDAIVLFAPHFAFHLDANASLVVHVFGVTLMGVQLSLHFEGPAPWRAQGSAEVEVLWASASIDVGPFTWGDADNPPAAPADPRQLVHDAIHHNPGAWQALTPPDADRAVRLKPVAPSDVEVTVHPMGLFEVRQHAVPLETVITHVGANPVLVGQRRVYFDVPLVNAEKAGALSDVSDLFSPGTFLDLTEDEKLSRPSFEPMSAGVRIRPPGEEADFDGAREADLEYETFVCDDDSLWGVRIGPRADSLLASSKQTVLAAGAAGRSDLRASVRYASVADPIVLANPGEVVVASKVTVTAQDANAWQTYSHAAEHVLAADAQVVRLGVT